MQKVGFWTKVGGSVRILGRGLGRGFKVSDFQDFKALEQRGRLEELNLDLALEPLNSYEYETLKL